MKPPCPGPQDLSVISGFVTPGSDLLPPHPLDASVTVAILDPTEADEPVRIVRTSDPFVVQVEWCICGPFAAVVEGCWALSVYMDDIDGVAPFHGLLRSATVDVESAPAPDTPDDSLGVTRCYDRRFDVPAGTVGAGVYSLVVVITLATGTCENPGPVVGDFLGYAQIPVLVFLQED